MNIKTTDKTVNQRIDLNPAGIDAGTLNSIHDTQPVDGHDQWPDSMSFFCCLI